MPVGTRARGQGRDARRSVDALGADIILANTYHLHLRPGDELIARAGGLHALHGLARARSSPTRAAIRCSASRRAARSSKRASIFQSHLDGSALVLTPESAVDIQARLGSDVAMMFDECPSWPATHDARRSRDGAHAAVGAPRPRSVPGARRAGACPTCRAPTPGQAQFGIIQGGTYKDLRDQSVAGHRRGRIRGLRDRRAVGRRAGRSRCTTSSAHTAAQLPDDRPRYLMGDGHAGRPGRERGPRASTCSIASCRPAMPATASCSPATGPDRHQECRATPRTRGRPIRTARCPTCRRHSRAYLRHLFMAGEMTRGDP